MDEPDINFMGLNCQTAWVTLATSNLVRLVDFYKDLLEQEPQPYQTGVYAEFQLPGLRLGLFSPRSADREEFGSGSQASFSLCLVVADLEGAIDQVIICGGSAPGPVVTAPYGRECYAYDPEGNRLILYQRV